MTTPTMKITGSVTEAIIYTDNIDENTRQQIDACTNHIAFQGSHIRIMPDVHAGMGSVIGFTSNLTDKIIPNIVGVDIGCGVLSINLGVSKFKKFQKLDRYIHEAVPSGFNYNRTIPSKLELETAFKTCDIPEDLETFLEHCNEVWSRVKKENKSRRNQRKPKKNVLERSIGTLGGGNHFIELDQDINDGKVWLTIHSGSRNFGLQVANYHQGIARSILGKMNGREYLEGENAENYYHDMRIAQQYAKLNRRIMGLRIADGYFGKELDEVEIVESIHNYIDFDDKMIRKGAIAAKLQDRIVVPFNMSTGIIIGNGRSNSEWNFSAPHGAGRVMSRTQAKRTLNIEKFKKVMNEAGVWSSCVVKSTLDEAPSVYKNTEEILEYIKPTIEVTNRLLPIYNFKAK